MSGSGHLAATYLTFIESQERRRAQSGVSEPFSSCLRLGAMPMVLPESVATESPLRCHR